MHLCSNDKASPEAPVVLGEENLLFSVRKLPEDVVGDQEEDLEAEMVAGEVEVVELVAAEEVVLVVEIASNFKCHPVLCK